MNARDKKKYERILEMQAEAKDMADRLDRMKEEAKEMRDEMLRIFRHDMEIEVIESIPGQTRARYSGTEFNLCHEIVVEGKL